MDDWGIYLSYHAVGLALDSRLQDLPAGRLQGGGHVAVGGSFADQALQRHGLGQGRPVQGGAAAGSGESEHGQGGNGGQRLVEGVSLAVGTAALGRAAEATGIPSRGRGDALLLRRVLLLLLLLLVQLLLLLVLLLLLLVLLLVLL